MQMHNIASLHDGRMSPEQKVALAQMLIATIEAGTQR
jgi:hypothetical protein